MNRTTPPKKPKGIFYGALYPYCLSLPYFVDKKEIKQAEILEQNWEVFRDEFIAYNNKGLTSHDVMRTGHRYRQSRLKTITLLTCMYRYHKKCMHFPKTMAILESLPELSVVSINVLGAHTDINAHYGETDATYRCHLGLIVPAGLPEAGIRVGNQERGWEEGKLLAFNDSNRHRAWNHSDADRVVLMVDFIKPELSGRKWNICGRALASFIMTAVIMRWGFLKKTPFFMGEGINIILGFVIISIVRLQRAFHFELPFISRN